jgi:hypothetical protein
MCVQPGVYTWFNALVRQTIVSIQLNAADLKRISFCQSIKCNHTLARIQIFNPRWIASPSNEVPS